jgi:hypothetical protein
MPPSVNQDFQQAVTAAGREGGKTTPARPAYGGESPDGPAPIDAVDQNGQSFPTADSASHDPTDRGAKPWPPRFSPNRDRREGGRPSQLRVDSIGDADLHEAARAGRRGRGNAHEGRLLPPQPDTIHGVMQTTDTLTYVSEVTGEITEMGIRNLELAGYKVRVVQHAMSQPSDEIG